MRPGHTIAANIVTELRRQFDADTNKGDIGWIDADNGTDSVVLDGRFDLDAVGEMLIRDALASANAPGWRCFHCGELFTSEACARLHFGRDEGATPACQIKGAEGGLLRALREAENAAADAWAAIHAESLDVHRALANAHSRHGQALTAQEELGYQRGLRDQQRSVDTLRRLLVWHGDPVRLARTREDWQQEVDEAVRFVRDNPEEGVPSTPTLTNWTTWDAEMREGGA